MELILHRKLKLQKPGPKKDKKGLPGISFPYWTWLFRKPYKLWVQVMRGV